MYKNLEAEMARKGISKFAIAEKLDMRYPTVVDKINGKYRLYFDEAVRIQKKFFPEYRLEYLFAIDERSEEEPCQSM